MAKIDEVIEEIKKILKEDTRGLTIQEISEKTKVSRVTARVALAKLDGKGEIYVRSIGKYKLHYPNIKRKDKAKKK